MTTTAAPRATAPPPQAWTLGWACVVGQLLLLADRGVAGSREPVFVLASMLIGAVVVGWFSAGVLTGRTVRTVLVTVLLGLSPLLYLVALVDGAGDGWLPLHLLVSLIELGALVALLRTPYLREQRAQARPASPPLGSVLALALLVGALGGVIGSDGPQDPDVTFEMPL